MYCAGIVFSVYRSLIKIILNNILNKNVEGVYTWQNTLKPQLFNDIFTVLFPAPVSGSTIQADEANKRSVLNFFKPQKGFEV